MKKVLLLLTLFIIILLMSGCKSNPDIFSCSQNSECIVVDSIEGLQYIPDFNDKCGCANVATINSQYLELWEQKREEFKDKLECDIMCKALGLKDSYIAKCENKSCVLKLK